MSAPCTPTDATLALQAARDIYTRRGEGSRSGWCRRMRSRRPIRPEKGMMFEPRGIQDLPAPDLLRRAGRSRAYVMAVASIQVSETPLVLYALRRADDALILGHRLSEWCGHAPMLEEDMALANMGLDLLGQARELYSYAAESRGQGSTTRISSPISATSGSTAISCCWSSRTAILRARWCGSSSMRPSPISIGAR